MKVPQRALLLLLVIVLASSRSTAAACGQKPSCGNVNASFYGEILAEGIVATWSTESEDAEVASYQLKRFNCGDPSACSVTVVVLPRLGVCGTPQSYTFTDYPPVPVSSWSYSLEVIRTNGTRACAVDIKPN